MPDTTEPAAPPIGFRVLPFRAVPWLPLANAQTIAGRFLRPRRGVALHRERVEMPDGDFVDLDYAQVPAPRSAPIVVVLHGLEGSARRGYMLNTYRALAARGLRSVGLNFRSCSGAPNRLPRLYHSGETGDLRRVLDHLAERFPDTPLAAIGYSLGGNVLLKYLGETGTGAAARLQAAVAVSVPFDLAAGARKLERGMGRVYTWFFLRSLRRKIAAKFAIPPGGPAVANGVYDADRLRRARTFHEFDDAFTAPLNGFADADDYYRRSSSAGFLSGIRVPTLLLHSRDDPFLPADALPLADAAENPYITAEFTERGGHVAFIGGGSAWAPVFWAETEAARFIASRMDMLRTAESG